MKKFIGGVKLILENAKKYFLVTLIVFGLMGFATFLNTQAPKIMANSFNALGEYIMVSVANNAQKDIENILNKNEITNEDKQEIIDKLNLTQKQQEDFLKMTSEQIKMQNEVNKELINIINIDQNRIKNGEGFSEEQLKLLNDSTLPIMLKQQIKMMSNEQLKKIAENNIDFESKIDEKYNVFMDFVVKLAIVYVILTFAMAIYTFLFVNVSVGTTQKMKNKLFNKIQSLSIKFYDMSNVGDLLSRFTNDIENITMFLNSSFIQISSNLFMLIGVGISMYIEDTSEFKIGGFVIQKPLFWVVIIFGLIAIFVSSFMLKKANQYVSIQQEKLGELNGFIDEILSGQKEVITYNLQEKFSQKFIKLNNELKTIIYKGQVYSGLLMPIMMGVGLLALGLIVFVGSDLVIQGIFNVGILIAFITYTQNFFNPLANSVAQYNMVELGVVGSYRVKEIMDIEEKIYETNKPVPFNPEINNIEFKDVCFSYVEGTKIIKHVNIDINGGENIAIVGPTGGGKTTIMNLINRFYDPQEGEILINGINIKEYNLADLRKNIGIVLQDSIVFEGTIFENISYGKKDASLDDVINAAKIANIHDYIMTLEDQYETKISNSSNVFSNGQKQLISIARTILTNPSILILDEATSNVDTITEAKIQKAMDNVIKGRTSFVIAHRLKTILNADKILVLKDGEIIEVGSHKELLEQKGFYYELYKNQFV